MKIMSNIDSLVTHSYQTDYQIWTHEMTTNHILLFTIWLLIESIEECLCQLPHHIIHRKEQSTDLKGSISTIKGWRSTHIQSVIYKEETLIAYKSNLTNSMNICITCDETNCIRENRFQDSNQRRRRFVAYLQTEILKEKRISQRYTTMIIRTFQLPTRSFVPSNP